MKTAQTRTLVQEGMKGSYDADGMLLSQSAAIRPVEMHNKPHQAAPG